MTAVDEAMLRDSLYQVSAIADDLVPYLKVLVSQFAPQQVILFGSYAYGSPRSDSDVDLLIVKDLSDAPIHEASKIRHAWWPIRLTGRNLGFDLLVESPGDHKV